MKVAIFCLLVVLGSCTYNVTIGKKLAVASQAAYASDLEIQGWTCAVCSQFPLTKVYNILILD